MPAPPAETPKYLAYDDFVPGATISFGRKVVMVDEITAWARAFDPQPFHLSEELARDTNVGRLIASGYHTCAMLMRMIADEVFGGPQALGSPGVEDVRFLRPVLPGDTLTARLTVKEKRLSRSRPDMGPRAQPLRAAERQRPGRAVVGRDADDAHTARAGGARAMSIYFEDLQLGVTRELGTHTFTREEIVDFAAKFDPQSFHLDDDAARAGLFEALTASGWHTTAIWLRHLVDDRHRERDQMLFRGERPARYGPSPGFEKLKWVKPVYVGDRIRFTTTIIEKRDWKARPALGLALYQNEGHNQHGELVFSLVSKMFVERRKPLE